MKDMTATIGNERRDSLKILVSQLYIITPSLPFPFLPPSTYISSQSFHLINIITPFLVNFPFFLF